MKSQKKKAKKIIDLSYNNLYLLPILIVIAVIPLLVFMKYIPTHLSQYEWYSSETSTIDCFLYYKQLYLLIMGSIMFCILALFLYFKHKEIRHEKSFLFLALYAVLAVLSTLLSKYRINGLVGIPDQLESVFILLVYCLLCYYSYQFIRGEKNIRFLLNGFMVSIGLLSIIGISQIAGHDLLSSPVGTSIVNSTIQENYGIRLNFGKSVFLTLFNPNYVGIYCVLVLPLLCMLLIYSKSWKQRLLYILLTCGMMICLIGSGSATGIITMSLSFVLLLLLNRHLLRPYRKITVPLFALLFVGIVALSIRFNLVSRLHGIFFSNMNTSLETIETKDDCVSIVYNHQTLNITFNMIDSSAFDFTFTDANGTAVDYINSDDYTSMTINDSRYPQFLIQPALFNDIYCFRIVIDNNDWYFTNLTDDGTYYYMNCYAKMLKLPTDSESALPKSFDSFASNRGFIWSKSIPLLKNHILLGSGADCFIFDFPNDDYIALRNQGFVNQVMTKPHSLYLQIGIQTGVVSLIAFILFYLCYFISSVKIYFRGPLDTYTKQIGAALLVSTAGYMFSGLLNDSTITVSPIYWVFLGLGLAVNLMNRKQMNTLK